MHEMPVYRLTNEAFRSLINLANEKPQLWQDPETDFAQVLSDNGVTEYREPTDLRTRAPIHMASPTGNQPREADHQALRFHQNFVGMTPAKASDPNLLAWINHFALHGYGTQRWPLRANSKPDKHVKDHWLTERANDIYESSIAGRTLWLAEICLRAEKRSGGAFTAEQALKLFSEGAERFHYCMRFSFMRNPTVTAEYIRLLLNEAQGINRRGIMALVRRLNLEAGARLIDAFDRPRYRELIVRTAEAVMRDERHVSDRRYLKGVRPLRVLSLGAGTQSTVMALMAEQGYNDMPKPDLAIFADTGWEPPAVYRHLDWLKQQLSYEVITVSAGNIRTDLLTGTNPRGGRFLDIPAYLTYPDGTNGMSKRQCTSDYKLDPIKKELRERLGLERGRRAPKHLQVEMWLGISTDEVERQKPSRDEWITNRWPLIEQGYSRQQLYGWFRERYPERELPRSACIGCPYHSNSEWKYLQEHDPESFRDAAFVDRALRELPHLQALSPGEAYLHRSRQPLEIVDFSETQDYSEMMLEECEGMCGI